MVVQSDGRSDVTYRNHRDWLPNLYLVQGWQTTMLVMYLKLSMPYQSSHFMEPPALKGLVRGCDLILPDSCGCWVDGSAHPLVSSCRFPT